MLLFYSSAEADACWDNYSPCDLAYILGGSILTIWQIQVKDRVLKSQTQKQKQEMNGELFIVARHTGT